MISPRFTEDLEEIAHKPPPIWAALFPAPNLEYKCLIFIAFKSIDYRDVEGRDNAISLFATAGQEEGPIIPHDCSMIYGRS